MIRLTAANRIALHAKYAGRDWCFTTTASSNGYTLAIISADGMPRHEIPADHAFSTDQRAMEQHAAELNSALGLPSSAIAEIHDAADGGNQTSPIVRHFANTPKPAHSPWGSCDHATELLPGLWTVSTPGHGGLFLSEERNQLIPDYMRSESGWYEEDCEWAHAAAIFPHAFKPEAQAHIEPTLKHFNPEAWEAYTGRTLQPGESPKRDIDVFWAANPNALALARWYRNEAWIPEGMIGLAVRSGRPGSQTFARSQIRYFVTKERNYPLPNPAQALTPDIDVTEVLDPFAAAASAPLTKPVIQLKNIKTVAALSEETICYSATLYVDGIKWGMVSNRGHGGSDAFAGINGKTYQDIAELNKLIAATFPKWSIQAGDEVTYFETKLEDVCGDLVDDHQLARLLRRDLKKDAVYFRGPLPDYGASAPIFASSLKGRTPEAVFAAIRAKFPTATIINELPLEQQLIAYRRASVS